MKSKSVAGIPGLLDELLSPPATATPARRMRTRPAKHGGRYQVLDRPKNGPPRPFAGRGVEDRPVRLRRRPSPARKSHCGCPRP